MSAIQLPASSEDFGISEFLLQMQLNAPHLVVSECYDISVKPVKDAFSQCIQQLQPANLVDVFVPVSLLQQPLSDIEAHGIRVNSKTGFRFQVGGIPIDGSKKTYEVVHLAIALGKVYNNQKAGAGITETTFSDIPPSPISLPIGYNSIRVSDNCEYVIFNANQINTLRLIRFDGGENMSHDPVLKHVCSECGQNNATIWCENDQCKLCEKCDAEAHKTKLTANHVRKPLKEALVGVQKCPIHPDHVVQYYCQKCHLPVCLECKVKGSHSKGEAAKHTLIDVSKALDAAMNSMSKPDPSFVTREKALKEQLKIADEKIEEIEEIEKQIEAEITRIAARAIEESRQQSSKNALLAKSAKLEILRKLKELEAEKTLIEAHKDNSEPLRFLQAFHRNQCLEREFVDNLDLPEPADSIDARLVVYGRLEVAPPRTAEPKVMNREIPNEDTITETEETDIEEADPHITSLSRMAKRKQDKYTASGISLSFQPFEGSLIITNPELATRLYLCFPFKGQPITHRMYCSEDDGRSVAKIHKIIDGHGITVIIVKSGENIFGGFASSKWNSEGRNFGNSSSSFIFQLNKDAFIPNRGQTEEPICLYATEDSITFGKYDLALIGSLDKCKSTIENSYGVGFTYGSAKAQTFLAGAPEFKADIVEVWGFFSGTA
jgi:hypothetical protein